MRVLALDVGSSSVRGRMFDERAGELEGGARRSYEPRRGRDGSVELDADELVQASRAVLDEAAGGAFDALGISCFWHSLLLVDADGRPLTPVLLWEDRRAAAQADELVERLDGQRVHARTGCYLHPSYWPAKLAWFQTERPDALAAARHVVSFGDYLFLRLTGELRTSLSMASGTGLFDLLARSWDAELLDALGLDAGLLAPIGEEPVGEPPAFPPLGDGACSNLGAGCTTPDRAALMVGTSSAFRVVREVVPKPRAGLFCYFVDERRVVEGGALSDGGNLHAWLERTLRLDHPELHEPDAHGLTFLPLLGGERSLGWNPHATGAVTGLTFGADAADLHQAALEGTAYRLADVAEALPEVREIVGTGHALLTSPRWIQLCADVLDRPVTASAVSEASARGAAVHALERLGADPDPAPLGRTYEPDPRRAEIYAAGRERQRDLYARLF